MKYNLEMGKVVSEIKEIKAKHVCVQLADGLKQYSKEIQEEIEEKTGAIVLIWLNSCYGACDIPKLDGVKPPVDLLVQFGHEVFIKTF